jgi:hypothetical protein
VTELQPPVVGAHDYVPRPCAHWTVASIGLRDRTGPLCVSQPPVQARVAAATTGPASYPGPRMEPLARCKLGPVVDGQLLQHMALHLPHTSVQDWMADFGAMHHTTPSVDNISTIHPLALSNPFSIIVGNGSSLLITSVARPSSS